MGLWNGIRYLLQRDRLDRELNDEVLAHIETRAAELGRNGLAPEEALRQARLEFGNVNRSKEATRRVWGVTMFEGIGQDLRYGFRQLRRSPGFAATAILSLALGIGANTAIFQLLNAVRLRSLPVRDPQQLVEVKIPNNAAFGLHEGWDSLTYPLWEQIRDHQESFSGAFAWAPDGLAFGTRSAHIAWVSGGAFSTLGVTPARGRLIGSEDDRKGCLDTAVLSYGFWQREFGGQDSAVGSRIVLGDTPFLVMGVTPPEFFGVEVGRTFDVALPFCAREHLPKERLEFGLNARNWFFLGVIGRLKDGESTHQAAQKLQARSAAWFEAVEPSGYDTSAMETWRRFRLTAEARPRGISALRDNYEKSLWLLLGITGLVLLIACVNLANLLLARSNFRVREYSVRMALGASRARVVVQLFWESLLIAGGGAVAGTGLAVFLSQGLVRFVSSQNDAIVLDLGLDWRVVAFITSVAIAACVTFGLSTALYATRSRAMLGAHAGTRNATIDRSRFSFQRLLMVGQIAISLVLVVASLLFVRSFRNLLLTDVGFEQEGLSYYFADFSRLHLPAKDAKTYAATLLNELRAIPGVDSAALTTHLPLSGSSWTLGVRIPGRAEIPGSDREQQANYYSRFSQFTWTSPRYFSTLGIPLVSGRDITELDSAATSPVVVVNEQFVHEYFQNENPVGKTVVSLREPGYPETLYQVVGVVKNTKYSNLREPLRPIAYAPDLQNPDHRPFSTVVIRSRAPYDATVKSVRAVAERLSPQLRINGTVNLRSQVLESLSRERLLAWLSGFFGVLAVVLATIGLYGVVSYMVSARRNEIGIRIALGAGSWDVVGMILGQTGMLLGIGIGVGLGAAVALSNSIASLLFGLQPNDPLSFAGAALALIVIGFTASWIPARRSATLDPNAALREE